MAERRYEEYVEIVTGWRNDRASFARAQREVAADARRMGATATREITRSLEGVQRQVSAVADRFGRMAFRYTYYALVLGRLSQYVLGRLITKPFYSAAEAIEEARGELRVLTDETAKYIDVLTLAAQQLSLVLPETATDIMKGMTAAIRAGRSMAEIPNLVKAASTLRLLSKQPLQQEIEFLSLFRSVFPQYGPQKMADILAKASHLSVFSLGQLEEAARKALSSMGALGLSPEAGVAQLLTFAAAGVPPTTAGTFLRRFNVNELRPQVRALAESAFSYLRLQQFRLQDEGSKAFKAIVQEFGGDVERARWLVKEIQNMPLTPDYSRPGETMYWMATATLLKKALEPEDFYQRIKPAFAKIFGIRQVETLFAALAAKIQDTTTGAVYRGIEAFKYLEEALKDSSGEAERMRREFQKTPEWAKAQAKATWEAFKFSIGMPMEEHLRIWNLIKTAFIGGIVGLMTGSDQLIEEWEKAGYEFGVLKEQLSDARYKLGQFRVAMIGTLLQLTGMFLRVAGGLGLVASTFGLVAVKAHDVATEMVMLGRVPLVGTIPAHLRLAASGAEFAAGPTGTILPLAPISPIQAIWQTIKARGFAPFKMLLGIFSSLFLLSWIWHADLGHIRSRMQGMLGELEGVTDVIKAITSSIRELTYPFAAIGSGLRMGFNAALDAFAWVLRGLGEITRLAAKAYERISRNPVIRFLTHGVIAHVLQGAGVMAGFLVGLAAIFWSLEKWGALLRYLKGTIVARKAFAWLQALRELLAGEGWEGLGRRTGVRLQWLINQFIMIGRLLGGWGRGISRWIIALATGRRGLREFAEGALEMGRFLMSRLMDPLFAFIRGLIGGSAAIRKLTNWIMLHLIPSIIDLVRVIGWEKIARLAGGLWNWLMGKLRMPLGLPPGKGGFPLPRGPFYPGLPPGGGPALPPPREEVEFWYNMWQNPYAWGSWGLGRGLGELLFPPVRAGVSWIGRVLRAGGSWLWRSLLRPIIPWAAKLAASAIGIAPALLGGAAAGLGLAFGVRALRDYIDRRHKKLLEDAAKTPFGIGASPHDVEEWLRLKAKGVRSPAETVLTVQGDNSLVGLSEEGLRKYQLIYNRLGWGAAQKWLQENWYNYSEWKGAARELFSDAGPRVSKEITVNVEYHPIVTVPEGTTKEQAQKMFDDLLAMIQEKLREAEIERLLSEQRQPGLATVGP